MKVKPKRFEEEILQRIAFKRQMPLKEVKGILSHNIVTMRQLCDITGQSWNKVKGLTLSRNNPRQPILQSIRPFQSPGSLGPEFIVVNEECIKFIKASL